MSNCKLCLADCAFKGKDMKKGNCKGYIPMSNADRIRAMSDEELAVVLCSADFCGCCDYERDNGICHYIEMHPDGHLFDSCVKAALRYLQATSEEET